MKVYCYITLFVSIINSGAGQRGAVSRLQLMAAPVIEGVRVPDDASDLVVHRNGKFIRNSFLPADSTVSIKLEEPRRIRKTVKLRRRGRSRFSEDSPQNLSPVYYLPEAPEALHADRGPYSFEPAASGLQPPVGEDRVAEQRPTIISASNDDFVIKQHSYQMCPGCPTFTIPIPIPKAAAEAEDRTAAAAPQAAPRAEPLLARLGGLVTTAVTSVTRLLTGSRQPAAASPLEKRVSGPGLATPSPTLPPVLVAGLAAIGVGVVGLMSVGGAAVAAGRGFGDEAAEDGYSNSLAQLKEMIDYDSEDAMCGPRNYCELVKRKKYLLDQWPGLKRVGVRVAETIWDRDHVVERGDAWLCNLRECVFSLLR